MSKKALDSLSQFKEVNLFLRGIVPMIGYKNSIVYYERNERFAGESKYPLKKMIKFAMDGLTAFSYKPLKLSSLLGTLLSLGSIIWLIVSILIKYLADAAIPGWACAISIPLFFNGLILMMLGIMGEYIGRIYDESKNRPLYIIREKKGFNNGEN